MVNKVAKVDDVMHWIEVIQYMAEMKARGAAKNLRVDGDQVSMPVFIRPMADTFNFTLEKQRNSNGFRYTLFVEVAGVTAIVFSHYDGILTDSPVCLSISDFSRTVEILGTKESKDAKIKRLERLVSDLQAKVLTMQDDNSKLRAKILKIKDLL